MWYEDRARLLSALCTFIRTARESIAYLSMPPDRIIASATKRQDLKNAQFVQDLSRQNIADEGFYAPWSRAISVMPLKKEEAELLLSWGETLGKSDRENQLFACDIALNGLVQMKEVAEKETAKQGRMWMSLGAIGGAFAVILLI